MHVQVRRKSAYFCLCCQVYLCQKKCFDNFHSKTPKLPPCCSALDRSTSRKTRSSSSASSTQMSPTNVTRKKLASSSPLGAISARLRERTKHTPGHSPSRASPSSPTKRRRRTDNPPQSSDERRVRQRLDNDLSSPPKPSRSGWSVKGIFSSFSSGRKR